MGCFMNFAFRKYNQLLCDVYQTSSIATVRMHAWSWNKYRFNNNLYNPLIDGCISTDSRASSWNSSMVKIQRFWGEWMSCINWNLHWCIRVRACACIFSCDHLFLLWNIFECRKGTIPCVTLILGGNNLLAGTLVNQDEWSVNHQFWWIP